MIEIELPDGTILEFPEGTSEDVMRNAITKNFPQYAPGAQQQPAQAQAAPAPAQPMSQRDWANSLTDAQRAELDRSSNPYTQDDTIYDPMTGAPIGGGYSNTRMQTPVSALSGAATGVRQNMLTFGFGDEIKAGVRSALDPNLDYATAIEQERAILEDAKASGGYGVGSASALIGAPAALGAKIVGKGAAGLSRYFLAGAVPSAIIGAGEAEGGFSDRIMPALQGGALGGAVGAAIPGSAAVAQWATKAGGSALRRLITQKGAMAPNGTLTSEGKALLEAAGYDVAQLSDDFAKAFNKRLNEGLDAPAAGAAAQLDEFGIPVMRANVTGDAADFAKVKSAAAGADGARQERAARRALDAQAGAVTQASDNLAERMGRLGDQGDAAITMQQALRSGRDAARDAAKKAYDLLPDGMVNGELVKSLGSQLSAGLKAAGQGIDRAAVNAQAAIRELDAVFSNASKGGVKFDDLERARQGLVRAQKAAAGGSIGVDQIATSNLKKAFDQKIDDLMTSGLIDGDPAFIAAAKKARGLWADYQRKYFGDDATSRFVQKMVADDASPDDVVKWMFGVSKMGSGRMNSTIAKGLKSYVGDTSDAWQMVRGAAIRQILKKPDGMTQYGPKALTERLGDFLTSPTTRELSRELFTAAERGTLLRYQAALKRLVAPEGALNPSGSGYEVGRRLSGLFKTVTEIGGAVSGGVPGWLLAKGGIGAGGAIADRAGARALMALPQKSQGKITIPGSVLGATGATSQLDRQ